MPYTKYTPEEVAAKGDAIFRQRLRRKVEPEYEGSYLVIDIETGAHEIDADDVLAAKRLLASRPDSVIYGLRIGSSAAYRIGRPFAVNQQ